MARLQPFAFSHVTAARVALGLAIARHRPAPFHNGTEDSRRSPIRGSTKRTSGPGNRAGRVPASCRRRQACKHAFVSSRAIRRRRQRPKFAAEASAGERSSGHIRSFHGLRWVARRTLRQSNRATRRPQTGPNRTILPAASKRRKWIEPLDLREMQRQTGFLEKIRFGSVLLLAIAQTAENGILEVSGAACRLDMVCPAGPHSSFKGQQS